jgi:cell division septal protein FtsQ
MEKHPWIRSVNLEKRFPHTLVIEAEKEAPCAMVVMNGLHYMNRWGKLFRKVEKSESMDFPLVTGITKDDSDGEKQLQLAASVLRLLEAEQDPWSHSQLSEVHVEKTGLISLYFISLPAVIELEGTELEKRMGDLKRLVKHLKKTGHIHLVERINLNFREGAVVSYKKDGVVS